MDKKTTKKAQANALAQAKQLQVIDKLEKSIASDTQTLKEGFSKILDAMNEKNTAIALGNIAKTSIQTLLPLVQCNTIDDINISIKTMLALDEITNYKKAKTCQKVLENALYLTKDLDGKSYDKFESWALQKLKVNKSQAYALAKAGKLIDDNGDYCLLSSGNWSITALTLIIEKCDSIETAIKLAKDEKILSTHTIAQLKKILGVLGDSKKELKDATLEEKASEEKASEEKASEEKASEEKASATDNISKDSKEYYKQTAIYKDIENQVIIYLSKNTNLITNGKKVKVVFEILDK